MKFPLIVEGSIDKSRVAAVIVDYARQVHQFCDLLIDGNGKQGIPPLPDLDLKIFNGLITSAIRLRTEMQNVARAGQAAPVARAVRQHLEGKVGRDFAQADVSLMLVDIKSAIDAFVPAAIAAQPVDAATGCIVTVKRDEITQTLQPYILSPAPDPLPTLVRGLRAAFESPSV